MALEKKKQKQQKKTSRLIYTYISNIRSFLLYNGVSEGEGRDGTGDLGGHRNHPYHLN